MSPNFPLSIYFVATMFVIYTISAYRQYIVMGMSLFWIYQYTLGRKKISIFGTGLLLLFHSTAIISLAFLLGYHILNNKRLKKYSKFWLKYSLVLILFACIIRAICYLLIQTPFFTVVLTKILSIHAKPIPVLISSGLVARIMFLILISYIGSTRKITNNVTEMLFCYYYIGMILYICIPLEFVMGRLMNNIHIISSILIPRIFYSKCKGREIDTETLNQTALILLGLILIALIILFNQLTNQRGYVPYENILFEIIR